MPRDNGGGEKCLKCCSYEPRNDRIAGRPPEARKRRGRMLPTDFRGGMIMLML